MEVARAVFYGAEAMAQPLANGVWVPGGHGLREFHHDDVYQPVEPAGLLDRLRAAGFVDVEVNVYKDQGWNASGRKPPY